jgi:hypothetical protein
VKRGVSVRKVTSAWFGVAAIVWLAAHAGGCATTESDTDMPWNTPQTWEGSPYIPGMTAD